ncbi:MAG: tyrosine-type recombinase/integrase [Nitrosotalea sp.]
MSNDETHPESKNSRALHLFESAIKSEATKVQYKLIVSKFLDWAKVDDVDNFVTQDQKKLQILIEDYTIYLKTKSGLSPNSIPRQFFALQLLFAMNDVILNWVKIRKLLPAAVKLSGEYPYTNDHLRMMLSNSKIPRSRALIHFTASTGCRIGAIPDLKIKHLTKMEDGCTAVLIYDGSTEEYYSFLTPEAGKSLDEYLQQRERNGEKIESESPVFTKIKNGWGTTGHIRVKELKMLMYRITKCVVKSKNTSKTRYDIQLSHGFRKRFASILKNNDKANLSLVEKLMGHRGVFNLDGRYHKPDLETLHKEFDKHIQNLTVDESIQLRLQLEMKNAELQENEGLARMNKRYKSEVREIKNMYLELRDLVYQSQSEKNEIRS